MPANRLALTFLVLAVAGCRAPAPVTPPVTKASTTPGTAPSPATAIGPTAVTTKALDLPSIPTEFMPTLAPSVTIVAAGGGNLIGDGGGTLIGAGGSTYRLAEAPSLADRLVLNAIRENVTPFLVGAALVAIAAKAAQARVDAGTLVLDKPFTEKTLFGRPHTMLLTHPADHWLLAFYDGDTDAAARQVATIAFTSKTKGEAVYRALAPDLTKLRTAMRLKFDLDAGIATGDSLEDRRSAPFVKSVKRVKGEFKAIAAATAAGTATQLNLTAYMSKVPLTEDGEYVLGANFQQGGAGALLLVNQTAGLTGDYYLDAKGLATTAASTDATVKAILPKQTELRTDFPPNPAQGDPYADFGFSK